MSLKSINNSSTGNNIIISESELQNMIEEDGISLKDLFNQLLINLVPILAITGVIFTLAFIYAATRPDIYNSTTMLKLSKPKGDILEAPLLPELSDSKATFVQNEIEILKSYSVRENVAKEIIDSAAKYPKKNFSLIVDKQGFNASGLLLPVETISAILERAVTIEQKGDLEIVNISVESSSPGEAAMIANSYAKVYHQMNLYFNREQMINVRQFLESQSRDKKTGLLEAENSLRSYQEQGGIIQLDAQTSTLINQLSTFEANRNAAKIDLAVSEKSLSDYKKELAKQEPGLKDYMEKVAIEPYLENLQKEISAYEVRKDVALNSGDEKSRSGIVQEYNSRISELKKKRDAKLKVFEAGMLALSSDDLKGLLQKVLEAEVKYHSSVASYAELNKIVSQYEGQFNDLPKRTINYARLEREKAENEKLYLLVQEKYQEALINEQATPGNVLIIDKARPSNRPSKPNRPLIILAGLLLGFGCGVGFVFVRGIFDDSVKTPEDIQKQGINMLGWVPQIDFNPNGEGDPDEFIISSHPTSIPAEAYRAIRTRIQFAKIDRDEIKTILITSGSPGEGKTISAVNIAGSFAQAGKRTLLLDFDLRKPRVNKVFRQSKSPGITDYLIDNAELEEVIRPDGLENLKFIAAGTIPVNPAELLGSNRMMDFLEKMKEEFDVIVIDSPPVLAVTDAEILSRIVDVTILVAYAEQTKRDVLAKSAELLMHDHGSFLGVLLNNFVYRNGYGNYYKNYYYYSTASKKKPAKEKTKIHV